MEWMYYILLEWIWNKKWEKNEHVIINGKNSYDEPNDSDIKRYEEIRKLTTGEDGDYTTGCLLDYDYIKNHYRLIAIDLNQQKGNCWGCTIHVCFNEFRKN